MRSLSLAILCVATVARAASPTVAVMPFKDLSGSKSSIGEAIRETVTTDLKDVAGMRVIERSNIDKVLAEQNLQGSKTDLDPLSTVKIGKLLGATLIVGGAYQKAGSNVRLTARFVKVETGEIVGTAKVDGASSDFLQLQDRVTAELLKSAGMEQKAVQHFAKRVRPKIKSLKTVELYGDAVIEPDDDKRRDLLKLALNEEPSFAYALKDLDALEKRMQQYAKQAVAAQDKQLREMRDKLAKETDPEKRCMLQLQVMTQYLSARRYRLLIAEARQILKDPPAQCPGNMKLDETAGQYLLVALNGLHDYDGLLHDGEAFLKKYTGSMYFAGVRSMMDSAISEKRRREEGKGKAEAELARMDSRWKWDLCRVAREYSREHQYKEAQRLYRACLRLGLGEKDLTLLELLPVDTALADWPAARKDIEELRAIGGERANSAKGYEMMIPVDG